MLATCTLVALVIGAPDVDPKARSVLEAMQSAWLQTKTLSYRLVKTERMQGGRVVREKVFVKIRRPGDIYLGALEGSDGEPSEQEVVYSAKRNATELTAHPGSFPDVTVSISIFGSLATRGQHHVITASGYEFLVKRISEGLSREAKGATGGRLEYGGSGTHLGRPVERVVLHAGEAKHARVLADRDESLYQFARRVGCDPYLIVYYNESLDGIADDVDEGERYVVPQYYGAKTELLIDADEHLPLQTTIWDFEGNIYERYEHHQLRVNPPLLDADFDTDNPAYDF